MTATLPDIGADGPATEPRRLGLPMSDVMVRALLDGHKHVTRRPRDGPPRYRQGDQLYVREAWAPAILESGGKGIKYRADGEVQPWPQQIHAEWDRYAKRYLEEGRWAAARFMFRRTSRTWLEVTEPPRVEPLHAIDGHDAREEGSWTRQHRQPPPPDVARRLFAEAWNEIYATRPWATNPSVERVAFRVLQHEEICSLCFEPLGGLDRDYCGRCEA